MEESWIELFRSAIKDIAPVVLSLATVDSGGDPQVRSVILRRMAENGGLWFTSDLRSQKNRQLLAHRNAAAVCWLAQSRQQFRFAGVVQVIGDEADRQYVWSELTPQTRAMFFWPEPGAPRSEDAAFVSSSAKQMAPRNFSLLALHPTIVEHLLLSCDPHRRRQWVRTEGWRCRELNP